MRIPRHRNAEFLITERVKSPPPPQREKRAIPFEPLVRLGERTNESAKNWENAVRGLISHKFHGRHVVAPAIL